MYGGIILNVTIVSLKAISGQIYKKDYTKKDN